MHTQGWEHWTGYEKKIPVKWNEMYTRGKLSTLWCTSAGHKDETKEDQDEVVSRTSHEWSCLKYKEFELYTIGHYKPL